MAWEAVRRWEVRVAYLVLVVMFAVGFIFLGATIGQVQTNTAVNADTLKSLSCNDILRSDAVLAEGEALAAPPAPNPARTVAVAKIIRAADRLRHTQEVCPVGQSVPIP